MGEEDKSSPVKTCEVSKGHRPSHVESGEEEENSNISNNSKGGEGENIKFRSNVSNNYKGEGITNVSKFTGSMCK